MTLFHVIQTKFKQCTVITIAQHIHTIIDADRIMVRTGSVIILFYSDIKLFLRYEKSDKISFKYSIQ